MFQILVDRSEYKIAFRSAVCTDDMKIQGEEHLKSVAAFLILLYSQTTITIIP